MKETYLFARAIRKSWGLDGLQLPIASVTGESRTLQLLHAKHVPLSGCLHGLPFCTINFEML